MQNQSHNLLFSILLACFFSFFVIACNGQDKPLSPENRNIVIDKNLPEKSFSKRDTLLMQVLRRIYNDSDNNLHIVGDGYYYKTKDTVINLSDHDYFKRSVIHQIVEDESKNIWLGTYDGLVKFIPPNKQKKSGQFQRFSTKEGLNHPDIWSMAIDDSGILWVGTLGGLNMFDGKEFKKFTMPEIKEDHNRGISSSKIVHYIMQDSKDNMWFATNGGAYIYDGKNLKNLSEKDGLCNNAVNHILEDKKGNIWFATHHDGVCYWDGKSFTSLTQNMGMQEKEVWSLYEDHKGSIWFPVENEGVYKYDGKTLKNFHDQEGLKMNGVHTITQDNEGYYWFGGFEGLYRYDEKSFTDINQQNISKN